MVFITKIQLFIFGVLTFVYYTQGRSISFSQIGDIRIEKTDEKWQCDRIDCPSDTYRCYVSKTNEEPSVLKRVNICYSKDNKILKQDVSSTPIDPNSKVRLEINSYRNGGISSINSSYNVNSYNENDNFDAETFNKELQEKLEAQLESFQHKLNKDLQQLEYNLQQMNRNIEKQIQDQQYNLQRSLSHIY